MVNVPQGFFRFSGWMLILGSIISAIVMVIHVEDIPASLNEVDQFLQIAVWSHVALFISVGMMILGVIGLYLRQAAHIKWWGWIGFVFMFCTFYFDAIHCVLQIFDYPVLFGNITSEEQMLEANNFVMNVQMSMPGGIFMMLTAPFLMLGTLMMGISFYKAKQLSRLPAIVSISLFVIMLGMFVGLPEFIFMITLTLFYLHFAWYGIILAFEKRVELSTASSSLAQ